MSFFGCLARLAQAYHRQTYEYLPRLKDLDDKLEEWRTFYRDAGYAGAEQDFFSHELRTHRIKAADRNTENNDTRSSLLYRARVWLFCLLGFATAAGIAYIAAHVRFHASRANSTQTLPQRPVPQNTNPPPPPSPFPPNREIREGDAPTRRT